MSSQWKNKNIFLRQNIISIAKEDINKTLSFNHMYNRYHISPFLNNSEIIPSFNSTILYENNSYSIGVKKNQDSLTINSSVWNTKEKIGLNKTIFYRTACLPYITKKDSKNKILDIEPLFRHMMWIDKVPTKNTHLNFKLNTSFDKEKVVKIRIFCETRETVSFYSSFYIKGLPDGERYIENMVRFCYYKRKDWFYKYWGERLKEKALYGNNIFCCMIDEMPTYQMRDLYFFVNDIHEGFDLSYFRLMFNNKQYNILPHNSNNCVWDYGFNNLLLEHQKNPGYYDANGSCDVTSAFEHNIEITDERDIESILSKGIDINYTPIQSMYRDCCDFDIALKTNITAYVYTEDTQKGTVQHYLGIVDKY